MGYSKIVAISETEVKILHQLDYQTGQPYAEDAVITAPPGRLDWLIRNDGKVGVFNFSFSPVEGDHSSLKFGES